MLSAIKALVRSNPTLAKAAILAALESHGGNRKHAAKQIGVSKVTFAWCVDALGIRAEIDARWPDRVRGGGVQSDEHKLRLAENAAIRWAKPLETRGFEEK